MRNRVYKIPKDKRKDLFEEALALSFRHWCDKLDCRVSIARVKTDKTPEWILNRYLKQGDNAHWTFIERLDSRYGQTDHFQICVSGLADHPNYFLWILVAIKDGENLVRKYDLNQTQ